jgi:hypothetical protein
MATGEGCQHHWQTEEVDGVSVSNEHGRQPLAAGLDPFDHRCRVGFGERRVDQDGVVVTRVPSQQPNQELGP